MKERNKRALVSSFVTTFILTSTLIPLTRAKAAASIERMPGSDRFVTAQNVAKQAFGKAENVILVNGLGYADAVSAAPLAKILDAPILLVDNTKEPYINLLETLWKLGTKRIYIVGGQGVVTKELESSLARSYAVQRIAGDPKDGRYGTNAAVAKMVLGKTKAATGVLVSAEGYADALSVASIAASKGYPVLFGNKNGVPNVVKEVAQGLEVKAVGGEGVLPDKVLSQVGAERIAKGADRFATNLNVLDYFKNELKFDNIFVAAGGNDSKHKFADALVASAAAAKYGAPVVLNGLGTKEESKAAANEYIKSKLDRNTKVTIIGGAASVDVFIESDLKNKAEQINSSVPSDNGENNNENNNDNVKEDEQKPSNNNGETDVESIEVLSLHQIKVSFNREVEQASAEDLIAYQINDKNLGSSKAKLSEDKKSVIVTLTEALKEGTTINFKIRDGFIITTNGSTRIKGADKNITLVDKKSPKVEKVELKGDNKVYITFSEGVSYEALKNVNNYKMDGKILDDSKVSISPDGEIFKIRNRDRVETDIVNGIILEFHSPLEKGQYTLMFPTDNSLKVVDAANIPLNKDEYIFYVK